MNTNQQTQSNSTTNTTNEENKLVIIRQGGTGNFLVGRIYKNYEFTTPKGSLWYPKMHKIYYEIGKELIDILLSSLSKIFLS